MEKLTVSGLTRLEIRQTWDAWTKTEHITQWTFASSDWHSPHATSELKKGGRFLTRMEAKDGSMGFDFEGEFLVVESPALIEYRMDDGREARISFESRSEGTLITEIFDPETVNPTEMQRLGWQAIMDNFIRYADALADK